ncbi:metallophosphoesterase family protein [Halalkalibacter krulwichiae]|uniref:Phosphoesterase n=1 Tax=Halalkalibacter krulwichiae TaxID=199441 RepID=A0A1X9MGK3_9BACI|nr:metallophosphoesterase [Halalkalibacter krulwichiae]ARK31640.1 hypothetical protein BkAM31D_18325 [Halalkalibacter krulwichiae]
MKALIISDSHGWTHELKTIIDRHRNQVDVIFHCGDSELSENDEALKGVNVVRGNCDFGDDFPEELIESVGGVTFFVAHGHHYNVKMTYVPLSYRAEEHQANVTCFGHSHVATAFMENEVLYINPGSIRLPRQHPQGTYCICEYDEKEISVTFFNTHGENIPELTVAFKRK